MTQENITALWIAQAFPGYSSKKDKVLDYAALIKAAIQRLEKEARSGE